MEVSPDTLLYIIGDLTVKNRVLEGRLAQAEQHLDAVREAATTERDKLPDVEAPPSEEEPDDKTET